MAQILMITTKLKKASKSMENDYRDSHLQQGKGKSYHATFTNEPYRRMVWQFEKNILDNILSIYYKDLEINYLDFACGTGRILTHLKRHAKVAVGVDLSPSMLEVARDNNKTVEIIEADLTRNDALGERKFNLITAFRFFPNAQPELQRQVMQVLTRHLSDNGCLVFNNHKNTACSRNRLLKILGRHGYTGMCDAEVKSLLTEAGLEIVKVYPLCVFPASEGLQLLPVSFLIPIETLLSKCRPIRNLGENLIYVCRKTKT